MQTKNSSRSSQPTVATVSFSDSLNFPADTLQWKQNGVQLQTKWHFQEGVELEMNIELPKKKHQCTGIVVACKNSDKEGVYDTTVFFMEPLPKPLLKKCRPDQA